MRPLGIIVLPVLIALSAILSARPFGTANSATKIVSLPNAEAGMQPQQTAGVVDGAVNPGLIPDRVAYSLLFRLIANRHTEIEKARIRAYIRQIGITDSDSERLMAAAEEFQQRVGLLDAQAKQIKLNSGRSPGSEVRGQLVPLQRQKDAIVDEIAASLVSRLTGDGMNRVRLHIGERVKRHVKFRPVDSNP